MGIENENELVLTSNVVVGKVETNCGEIKPYIARIVDFYKDKVFLEEDVKIAKKDVAKLRKLREAINTRKRDVKRDYLIPLTTAEIAFKGLMAMLDEPIQLINAHVQDYGERVKKEKQLAIDDCITEALEGDPLNEYIRSCDFFADPRWLNVGVKMSTIEKEIKEKSEKITGDFNQLLQSDFFDQLSAEYKRSGNLGAVLNLQERLAEVTERNLRMKLAQEETLRIKKEERELREGLAPKEEPIESVDAPEPEKALKTISINFTATGTTTAMIGLGDWCRENGITLRRI